MSGSLIRGEANRLGLTGSDAEFFYFALRAMDDSYRADVVKPQELRQLTPAVFTAMNF